MTSKFIDGLDLDSDIAINLEAWQQSLRAQGKRPATIKSYLDAARLLDDHLKLYGMPRNVAEIRREHVESHIAWLVENRSSNTAGIRYRALRVFFNWLVEEGEIKTSPMGRMKPPKVDEVVKPVYTHDQMKKLLASVRQDTSFLGRRDYALMMMLASTGARRSEIANLALDESSYKILDSGNPESDVSGWIDWRDGLVVLKRTKGRTFRTLHLHPNVKRALVRYAQIRQQRRKSSIDWLWLSNSGRVTKSEAGRLTTFGLAAALKRRCEAANLPYLPPHSWRHGWVTRSLERGMSGLAVAANAGWTEKSAAAMLARYTRAEIANLARKEEAELGYGKEL